MMLRAARTFLVKGSPFGQGAAVAGRNLIIAAVALVCLIAADCPAQADDWIIGSAQASPSPPFQTSQEIAFSIPQGPLQTALEIFSAQSGVQTLYQAPITEGRQSYPVTGTFDAATALRQLLQGSGLTALEVFRGGYTLVTVEQAAIMTASNVATISSVAAPILTLSTVHIEAPSEKDRRLYAQTVRYAIQNALLRNHDIRLTAYSADLFVWVSSAGVVQNTSLFSSTGNPDVDLAIGNIVRAVEVGRSPPFDLPQPVHVRILTQSAQR
jgi:hypothetical protein